MNAVKKVHFYQTTDSFQKGHIFFLKKKETIYMYKKIGALQIEFSDFDPKRTLRKKSPGPNIPLAGPGAKYSYLTQ